MMKFQDFNCSCFENGMLNLKKEFHRLSSKFESASVENISCCQISTYFVHFYMPAGIDVSFGLNVLEI